ncbi:MAG: glycerol acyltransferase [Saprospiraceae bacterium]|nr:glycerol acyltransferase [Saprospiraceae bacterium]
MKEKIQLYPHITPKLEDWPIYKLSLDRKAFIEEINHHTVAKLREKQDRDYSELLSKAIYQERIRMRDKPWRVDPPNEKHFWKKIRKRAEGIDPDAPTAEKQQAHEEVMYRIVDRYAEEIVGSFVPSTFLQARKILTALFKRLLSKRGSKTRGWGRKEQLYHKIKIYGPIEQIRSLAKQGTIVMVPTHFSNLDSVLIGYAIDLKVGLPSFSYGAGLNLYNFGPAAYFMNRLGAYRVDRRKKNPIYLETLKSMSSLSIDRGIHSLFFPGGTRSRSGKVESNLKLGLLNTVLEAQRSICQSGKKNKVFVVPLILDYHFVLEARFLIEQYLRSIGKEKYMDIRDDSTSKRKLLKFLFQYYNESSEIVMSFGKPFDVLGNFVDKDGTSFDDKGRQVEVEDYFRTNDHLSANHQRESVYTRLLSNRIVERFKKDNVVLTSHLVAFTAFQLLVKSHPQLDLFGVLKLPPEDFELPIRVFEKYVDKVRQQIFRLEEENCIRTCEPIKWDIKELVADGVEKLGLYHAKKPLIIGDDGILTTDNLKLLLYYSNRLDGYNLNEVITRFDAVHLAAETIDVP